MTDRSSSEQRTLAEWAHRLRSAGRVGLRETPLEDPASVSAEWIASFRDASGQRHYSDLALLARLCGIESPPGPAGPAPDSELWAAVLGGTAFDSQTLAPSGPLWPDMRSEGIEAWTLTELRGLHALWWLAVTGPDERAIDRALNAARWHVAELQPDNATNRPWAVHAFVSLGATDGASDALMHAQTLLHNALITGGGRPEIVSAAILLDAACALERGLDASDDSDG